MNTNTLKIVGLFAFILFMLTACSTRIVRGSGNLISDTRTISNFDRINLNGSGKVIIIQGEEESLLVETDDNIMEYVTTEIHGSTLELDFDFTRVMTIDPTQITFTLHVKDLAGLNVSGSGDIIAQSIETDNLDVDVSSSGSVRIDSCTAGEVTVKINGSGQVEMAGEATRQTIDISGSGKYIADNLYSDTANINLDGSGTVTIWVAESLDAELNGSGSVSYYGTPTVNSTESGSGTLISLGEK